MKKLISALLSAALLAGVAAMPVAAEETYSLGDVTMDGVVDLADAMDVLIDYTQMILLRGDSNAPDYYAISKEGHILTDEQLVLADVYGDGYVDTGNAIMILSYYTYTLTAENPISMEEYVADALSQHAETMN